MPDIRAELKALYPQIQYYTAANVAVHNIEKTGNDTLTLVVAHFTKALKTSEKAKLEGWLKSRLAADSVKLVVQ